ncbi:AAA family ATPase (plasmid) [Pseudomonas nitroreducens]|uniref:AAA family ATPase n=1 Tax=Pseudomonas nitroreducens TaxID=46680 RepID=UPI0003184EA5|nr:AAA family ATPase [Pseudomonas nitroreducens]
MKETIIQRVRRALRKSSVRQSLAGCGITLAAFGAFLAYHYHLNAPPALPAAEGTSATIMAQIAKDPSRWTRNPMPWDRLLSDVREGKVQEIDLGRRELYVTTKDNGTYVVTDGFYVITRLLMNVSLDQRTPPFSLQELELPTEIDASASLTTAVQLTILVFFACMFWPMLSTRLPARKRKANKKIRFDDVVGCEEAKRTLMDMTAWLRAPKDFAGLNARPPKGVLFLGPPGVGKTLLAKALANECGANFIETNGSQFSSMFYGVGIQKVRALFREARRKAPCLIFVDEIDGLGARVSQARVADGENNRILNQFLTELDGFSEAAGVMLIAATNNADALDKALRREGRIDRTIYVGLPPLEDRTELFRLYLGRTKPAQDVDYISLAQNSMGLSPAAIAFISNNAALLAAREGAQEVEMRHAIEAIEIQRMGEAIEVRTASSAQDRKRVAVHEAGHALVGAILGAGRVEKITILPRGPAQGVTVILPSEDKQLHLKSELQAQIAMALGGRAAEQEVLDMVSTGAAGDLQEATRIALAMVHSYGMAGNDSLLSLSALRDQGIELDTRDITDKADSILKVEYQRALEIMASNREALDRLIAVLLEQETISGDVVYQVLGLASEQPTAALPAKAVA